MNKSDLQSIADDLYSIDSEVTPKELKVIGTLRQLINEEFEPKKLVTNQFIYNVLKDIL